MFVVGQKKPQTNPNQPNQTKTDTQETCASFQENLPFPEDTQGVSLGCSPLGFNTT